MKTKQETNHTFGSSLVSKLTIQLGVRLGGTVIKLNAVFLAASAVTLGGLGERQAALAVRQLEAHGLPALAESA